ncbi:ECF transporter S component [Pseudoclavibacter terrae]|uniref:ECF transporter S component n=1 Tax=Pseudoclavibacter terrae TaxID=1530195 RepID=A0A7J5B2L3_9MICO|nr:ECF transporter S component [Pseudoclavibacter terrae]KAB1637736.1 hypothetical protein F8O03_11080 [Pseudoclavibacter terrae]
MADADRETCDVVVADLRRLRAESGGMPFAEIASRIQANRRSVGSDATGPARTTVFEAFRPGRSRLDARLIGEIVEVLGAPPATVPEWVARAGYAIPSAHAKAATKGTRTDGADATPAEPAESQPASEQLSGPTPVVSTAPAMQASGDARPRRQLGPRQIILIMTASILLNLAGHLAVSYLRLPLFFDMIGTAVTAIVVGPWAGVLVAIVTNTGGVWLSGPHSIWFSLVNVAGALVWGYGARRFGMASTLPRYFLLTILVALSCSAVAVPILLGLFHGGVGHAGESIVWTLQMLGQPQGLAVLGSNLVNSLADKLITGFVALVAVASIAARWVVPGIGDRLRRPLSDAPEGSA